MADPRQAEPWKQTASGTPFFLVNPLPELVDFKQDIPDALARIARFTGHVPAGPYSVAQHSVIGADAIFEESGRGDLAAAFLLHDAHEAYCGDIATPVAEALAALAVGFGFDGSAVVRSALKTLKWRLDVAIHRRANMPFPHDPETQRVVKLFDARMLLTEKNHMLARCPRPWGLELEGVKPIPMHGALKPWPWTHASEEYTLRLKRWCPAALDFYPGEDVAHAL